MHFTLIKQPTRELKQRMLGYFMRSKPYSFCEVPSRRLAMMKSNEYIDFLFETSEVYVCAVGGSIKFLIAISVEAETSIVDFAFGEPFWVIRCFSAFRQDFFKKNPHIISFNSVITRSHKLQSYLAAIRRYDKEAKIKLDNGKICIYWYS